MTARKPTEKRATKPKPPRFNDVMSDIRDRFVPKPRGETQLASYAHQVAGFATTALAEPARHDPCHFDATVAPDFRETMLAIACVAVSAVLAYDQRAIDDAKAARS